jgi:hyperosmotically inducible protein
MNRRTLQAALAFSALALAGAQVAQAQQTTQPQERSVGDKAREAGHEAKEAVKDTAITTAVKAKILAEPGLKVLEIGVDTDNGVVTLSGAVDTALSLKKAEQLAAGTDGVKSVQNKLTVRTKSSG